MTNTDEHIPEDIHKKPGMCVKMYVYADVYVHVHAHVVVHAHVHVYIYIYTHTIHIHIHICKYTNVHMHIRFRHIHIHRHVHIHIMTTFKEQLNFDSSGPWMISDIARISPTGKFMGSYNRGYKSPDMGFNYCYPSDSPTYDYS